MAARSASLRLDLRITRPARAVGAVGAGFAPGSVVRLARVATPGLSARAIASGTVDPTGHFRLPVLVLPGEPPGRWTVQAVDATGRRARTTLLVVPAPLVPDRGSAALARVARSRAVQR